MSWKFIDNDYEEFDAAGASPYYQNTEDLGYIFYDQTLQRDFRVANDGTEMANYKLYASGQNTTIVDDVEFSKNKKDWYTEIYFSGVTPNSLTDTCWYRYSASESDYTTSGTFYVAVSEV